MRHRVLLAGEAKWSGFIHLLPSLFSRPPISLVLAACYDVTGLLEAIGDWRHEAGLRKSKVLDHRISRNGSKFLNFNTSHRRGGERKTRMMTERQ